MSFGKKSGMSMPHGFHGGLLSLRDISPLELALGERQENSSEISVKRLE